MMKMNGLITILLGLFSISICSAGVDVVDTIFPTDDIVIANVIVNGSNNGLDDATPRIQAAIDRVHSEGGGVVFLPAGKYRIDGNIFLRKNVTLRGDWAPPVTTGWQKGTILMPTADRGNADATPAIRMLSNCGIRNLTIWYPDQNSDQPVPYPWSISTAQRSDDPGNPIPADMNISQTISNVTLVNSYKGITIGPTSNLLHVIRNIYGTPLKIGISIDTCVDIGRTQNINFSPDIWEKSGLPCSPVSFQSRKTLREYLMREGTGFDIGRDEWGYLYDIKIKGYATGLIFRTGWGNTNGMVTSSQFTDCGTALRMDDVCPFGIGFTGCRFSGKDYAVYASKTYVGVAQFNNCRFESRNRNAIYNDGPGTMTFQNCDIEKWDDTAFNIENGSISMLGCKFNQSGTNVVLGKNVKRALLVSNKFKGKPSIINQSSQIDLQVSHAPLKFSKPDISLMKPSPDYKPATRKLFNVTDYGANPNLADNTRAFVRTFDAARREGGGTVYVPAGAYRFRGEITVPSGVELRGCFDVQHHSVGMGSALLPLSGKGNTNGMPFIRLESGSGIRGLTVWYPDQDPQKIIPYPWTVQGLGPGCWIINLNCGNSYNGVDFWTYPSDGHVIKYLSGAYYNKGLFISKCKGDGWVDDLHFNPHYSGWVDTALKPIVLWDWNPVLDYVRSNLEAIVFGRCEREHIKGTFMYAAKDGLAFRDDNGGTNARVIHHGTDNGARCVAVESSGQNGIEFIGLQLTPLSPVIKAGISISDSFRGKVSFFNTIMFQNNPAIDIAGKGDVLVQQLNNVSGSITLRGGKCRLENSINKTNQSPDVHAGKGCDSICLVGNINPTGTFQIDKQDNANCIGWVNSLPSYPQSFNGKPEFTTGWEDADNNKFDKLVQVGVTESSCEITDIGVHSGTRSLRIAGTALDPQHSYVYFNVLNTSVAVYPDTVLSYWIKPMTSSGMHSGIDLGFSDGSNMRDSVTMGIIGKGLHPTDTKGETGVWKQIIIPLGQYFPGKTISSIMFAYDNGNETGTFETLVDDLVIESKGWNIPRQAIVTPPSGTYTKGLQLILKVDDSYKIRYTLDGTIPDLSSPCYSKPIVLDKAGLYDLRYIIQAKDGNPGPFISSQLYNIINR